MARKRLPKDTVPRDVVQEALDGQAASTPPRQTAGDMASHTDGDGVPMTKLTHRVTQELADALRRHYHERRLAGDDITMSAIVEAALRAHLGLGDSA